jgi:phage protein D
MSSVQLQSASVVIKHNGAQFVAADFSQVASVSIDEEINRPTMFAVKMNLYDWNSAGWRGIDMKKFLPGDKMEISMGMDKAEKIFTGEITELEPEFSDNSYLTIRGYDKLHRLRFGRKRRSFLEIKDSDIAQKIASEVGLSAKSDATSATYPYVFQNNVSNYSFLMERAERIGYEIGADGDKLLFKKSQEDKKPEITLEFGIDLERFSAKMKALTQGSEVEYRGWSVKDKKEIKGKAKKGDVVSKMNGKKDGFEISSALTASAVAVINDYVLDDKNAEEMAKAQYNIFIKNFITGEGSCNGNAKIRAGKTVELKGLGDRFTGPYYIVATTHNFNYQQGYSTRFKVRRTGI